MPEVPQTVERVARPAGGGEKPPPLSDERLDRRRRAEASGLEHEARELGVLDQRVGERLARPEDREQQGDADPRRHELREVESGVARRRRPPLQIREGEIGGGVPRERLAQQRREVGPRAVREPLERAGGGLGIAEHGMEFGPKVPGKAGGRYPPGDMRKTLGALALVCIALLGAGCKKASPLVGKWSTSSGVTSLELEFKPENAYTMAIKVGGREFDLIGDYKLEGDSLTITPKDVNLPGLSAAQLAVAKTQVAGEMGKPTALVAKFPTDDQLSLTSSGASKGIIGKSTLLTRVKTGA